MEVGFFVGIMRGGIIQVLTLAGPILFVALIIGLAISIFQAVTSIQDQTITFVPKILAIFLTLSVLGGWIFTRMGDYTINLFEMIPQMAR